MRAVLSFGLATALVANAHAQALNVSGQLGVLGEWELSATLSRGAGKREAPALRTADLEARRHLLAGRAVGKGRERPGSTWSGASRVRANFVIDGVTCTYRSQRSDTYTGLMSCPARPTCRSCSGLTGRSDLGEASAIASPLMTYRTGVAAEAVVRALSPALPAGSYRPPW